MSNDTLIVDLMQTAIPLPNDRRKELLETARLMAGKDGPAWKAVLQRRRKAGLPNQPKSLLLSVVATNELGDGGEKATARCFTGSRYAHRDSDLDNWLPSTQPKVDDCVISILAIAKDWLFAEAARALPGVKQTSDIAALGRSLIANGYTMTLPQMEAMVERTANRENTGMRTDGWGNFFFVETGDSENPVSVGYVYRRDSRWYASVGRLGDGRRWGAVRRLLVRNLDASKLGL